MSQQVLRQSGRFQLIETTMHGERGQQLVGRAYTVSHPDYDNFYQGPNLQEAIAVFDRAVANVANDH